MVATKSLVFLTFWLACLALAGCAKSEPEAEVRSASSQTPARPATTPAKPSAASNDPQRPALVVLGDSLAEGFGVDAGKSFPDQLQQKLDAGGYAYRIVNLGVSGDTTTGGLGRTEYALSLKPAIVILELGGNDGLRGIPVASTKQNLEAMIVKFRNAGSSVLLAGMTLPPNYGEKYIQTFERAYKDLAGKYSLPLIPFLMEDIRSQMKTVPNLMQRDGIHPTADGHAIIAETVFRYLKPMLKRA
jgi:acyl-CoA thioesterase I